MHLAGFGEAGGSAPGQPYRRILTEEDVAGGPGELERQDALGAEAGPPGPSAFVHRCDEAALSAEVDVGDLPAPPGEQEPARPLDLLGQQIGVGPADFGTAVEDGELRWCGEHGHQVHEVPVTVTLFGLRADEQQT